MSERLHNPAKEMYVVTADPLIGLIGEGVTKNMRDAKIEQVAINVGRLQVHFEKMPHEVSDLGCRAALLAALGMPNKQISTRLDTKSNWTKELVSLAFKALEVGRRSGIGRRMFELEVLTVVKQSQPLSITEDQLRVVDEVSYGLTNNEAAGGLQLAPLTIKSHLHNATQQTRLMGREQIALACMATGQIGDFVLRDLQPEQYAAMLEKAEVTVPASLGQ